MDSRSKMWAAVLIFLLSISPSSSKSLVKNLPGFSPHLPFTLETGYIGVGKGEEVQLFYYFVESERNPETDPLFLYLTGGPGTSGLIAMLFQIGPLIFKYANAEKTKVKLEVNPYSWTKTANVIFIDMPVGAGFSYAKTSKASSSSDSLFVTQAYEFMRKWVMEHPKFESNPLYITGSSYMGIILPILVSEIYNGIEHKIQPKLNIKGYLLINPLTHKFFDFNSRIEFAYRTALIEDEIYKPARRNCQDKFVYVDPNNTLCLNSLRPINECINEINVNYILEPLCDSQHNQSICRESIYEFSNIWANKKVVRQALNIREGTVKKWSFNNDSIHALLGKGDTASYSYNIFTSLSYHKNLINKDCHVLIINGDHDMTFPYMGTKKWINNLNLRVETPWKPWFVNDQVAGYQKTYSNPTNAGYSMKYATIKGAGHAAASYKPKQLAVIMETWIASHVN